MIGQTDRAAAIAHAMAGQRDLYAVLRAGSVGVDAADVDDLLTALHRALTGTPEAGCLAGVDQAFLRAVIRAGVGFTRLRGQVAWPTIWPACPCIRFFCPRFLPAGMSHCRHRVSAQICRRFRTAPLTAGSRRQARAMDLGSMVKSASSTPPPNSLTQ